MSKFSLSSKQPNRIACLTVALGLTGILGFTSAHAALSPCKFNFGVGWNGKDKTYAQAADFVTIWAGSDDNWNTYWIGDMLKATRSGGVLAGKTPVFYAYFIAFTARRDLGLQDCNVGSPNLCEKGANYIRQQKSRILAQYTKYATEAAKVMGSDPVLWMMEPDYYQYAQPGSKQEGGPLTFAEAGAFMGEIVATIRKSMPNAIFSMDISPWVADPAAWFAAFKMDDFTYINTSGGGTDANNTKIRAANNMTWKGVHDLTKKPIIADDGYGVAGSPTFHDATWDDANNLKARIADGVVAISQTNPKSDWNNTISPLVSSLPKPACTSTGLRNAAPLRAQAKTGNAIRFDAIGRPVGLVKSRGVQLSEATR